MAAEKNGGIQWLSAGGGSKCWAPSLESLHLRRLRAAMFPQDCHWPLFQDVSILLQTFQNQDLQHCCLFNFQARQCHMVLLCLTVETLWGQGIIQTWQNAHFLKNRIPNSQTIDSVWERDALKASKHRSNTKWLSNSYIQIINKWGDTRSVDSWVFLLPWQAGMAAALTSSFSCSFANRRWEEFIGQRMVV